MTPPPTLRQSTWRAGRVFCFGYDIFLSYKHCDAARYAIELWRQLEVRGLTTCIDHSEFHVGERLIPRMRKTVRSSRTLLLLDTLHARTSEYVQGEVVYAETRRRYLLFRRHLLIVRDKSLAPDHWSGQRLIELDDSPRAIEDGVPREDIASQIDARFRFVRVRTQFAALMCLTLALNGWLGTIRGFEMAFEARAKEIRSEIDDDRVNFSTLDAHAEFTDTCVHRISRWLNPRPYNDLKAKISEPQLKRIRQSTLADVAQRAQLQTLHQPLERDIRTSVASRPPIVATLRHQRVVVTTVSGDSKCQPLPEPPIAVALSADGSRLAALTSSALYLWRTTSCIDTPIRTPRAPADAPATQLPLEFTFSRNGEFLLLAEPDRLVRFRCEASSGCRVASQRTIDVLQEQLPQPDAAFFDAAISPDGAALAAAIASRTNSNANRTICLFLRATHCVPASENDHPTFVAGIDQLVTVSRVLRMWLWGRDDPGRVSLDLAKADHAEITDFDHLAFNPARSRLATAFVHQAPQGSGQYVTSVSLFDWPSLAKRGSLDVDTAVVNYLLMGSEIVLGTDHGTVVFDYRNQ
jgi:hypothetical protein